MEESISLDELIAVVDEKRAAEYRHLKFLAALQGVNLDEPSDYRFEEMKLEAEAIASGRSVDEVKFEEFGIKVISELE